MKIVDVCEFYSPTGGGVKRYIDQKLEFAPRFGHELTVIAPGTENRREERPGGAIIWVKSPQLPFDPNYRMFWRAHSVWDVLNELKPDLVEGSSPWRGGWLTARWHAAVPKVFFMHMDPVAVYPQTFLGNLLGEERVDRMFGWFWNYLNRLNGFYDAAIVTNPAMAQRFGKFGLENIEVAPFGVEREKFSPQFADTAMRREMLAACNLPDDATLLIAVGRHHPEKRLNVVIDAVTRAQPHRPIGLYIVGNGLIRKSVEKWARAARHVFVAGQIKDQQRLARVIASADALIHGSSAETFGLVLAEALCSGTPVVVPDAGASATFAGPGYAETYRPGDAADGAAAILALVAGDRAAQAHAALAAADARVNSVEQHFKILFGIYERVVAERARRQSVSNQSR